MGRLLLEWLEVPAGAEWLDVGCGTGASTTTILEQASPAAVMAVDPSPGFVEVTRSRLGGQAVVEGGDAQALPFDPARFDVTVSGLVLNFVPDPAAGLAEMRRVTRTGGTVAVYVWDYAEGMEMIRRFWDVAVRLDPSAHTMDEVVRFPICRLDRLVGLFERTNLGGIRSTRLEGETRFTDFDDFWQPFLGGTGPAPTYVSGLTESRRARLATELRRNLPTAEDGSIVLRARALAVRGTA